MAHLFDQVIGRGVLANGPRAPLYECVAIRDGRIAADGYVAESGREEIDARGRAATPRFVDLHTHYDRQATWDRRVAPSSRYGVTTLVKENYGVGFAPARPGRPRPLIELMEGVEDIQGATFLHDLRFASQRTGLHSWDPVESH